MELEGGVWAGTKDALHAPGGENAVVVVHRLKVKH